MKLYHYVAKGNDVMQKGYSRLQTILMQICAIISSAQAVKPRIKKFASGWKVVTRGAVEPSEDFPNP